MHSPINVLSPLIKKQLNKYSKSWYHIMNSEGWVLTKLLIGIPVVVITGSIFFGIMELSKKGLTLIQGLWYRIWNR